MRMKGKVFLAMIAIMIFLVASICIAKEVKAEELYTIAWVHTFVKEINAGYIIEIRIPRECKLGDVIPIVFEFHFNLDEEISYFHFYGNIIPGKEFDKEYTDINGKTTLTETFETKLDEPELNIDIKYEFYLTREEQRFAGYYWMRMLIPTGVYESQINTLQSQINELNNELNDLKNKNTELSSQLSDLQMTYDNLDRDYEGLERDHDSLKASHDSLQTDHNSLETDYTSLQTEYNSLKSSYDSLTRDYNGLESKYQVISELGELGTTRSLMYIFLITTSLFIATTIYFARRKPS